MLGFSVYLGQQLDKDYILKMASMGYDVVFTSLQIPEESKHNQLAYLGELCQLLSSYKITYIIDVNPSLLNQSLYSYLTQLPHGTFYIRIDDQLNVDLIQEVQSHGLKCCLNASTVTEDMLALIYQRDFKAQLLYCHNYYPRPDTGLSFSFIKNRNDLIQKYDKHAKICAFIPGSKLRGPLFKGLPTIESHRKKHPLVAAHELHSIGVSDILISDLALSQHLALQLSDMLKSRHFTLRLDYLEDSFSSNILKVHTSRIDSPENIIRSQFSRAYNDTTINAVGTTHRHVGDITVDNQLNGRYEGEIQVLKVDLPGHPHINYIAHINSKDIPLLALIQPGDTFRLTYTKENDNESLNH